mmetsp:Transcript_18309/g.17432  ORF Transcript_18309/g.17432 Transcript_18309/m.17432 type:complete len:124 (+) Transcript_18309:2414-2785(+)
MNENECTFRPNLNNTQKINKNVKSVISKKPDPRISKGVLKEKNQYSYNIVVRNQSSAKLIKHRTPPEDSFKSPNLSRYLNNGCPLESTSQLMKTSEESLNADLMDCLKYQSVINSEKNDLNFL